ncbi:hypothetical protein Gotur_033952 [Gossypium turneri]
MSKEEFEQRWARKSLRETLSAVEERVGKLEGSMEDVNMDKVNELFNSHRDKLSERNDALEAMMMALKEETMATTRTLSTKIEELNGELALCRAAWGKEWQMQHSVTRIGWKTTSVPKVSWMMRLSFTQNLPRKKLGKSARDNATGHSGGVCSRVLGTHAPSFRGDRKRGITCFSEWIEAVGQTRGGTKKCPKAVGSHDGS